MVSCNYVREQKLPQDVSVKSYTHCSIEGSYSIKRYELEGFNKSMITKWHNHLTCEHYSKISSSLKMTNFNKLSEQDRENLKFFLDITLECDNVEFKINNYDDLWFSGCRTQNESKATNIKFDYDMLCVIDTKKAIMYEIKYLN
jgi:hypothetical protein